MFPWWVPHFVEFGSSHFPSESWTCTNPPANYLDLQIWACNWRLHLQSSSSATCSSVNCSFIWLQAFCTFWLEVDVMYKLLLWPFAEAKVRCKVQVLVLGNGFQISAVSLLESWQDCWFPDHSCKEVWDTCDPAARVWNSLVWSRTVYNFGAGKLWCGLEAISNFTSVCLAPLDLTNRSQQANT